MSDNRNQVIDYITERFAKEDDVLKQVLENQLTGQGPQMNIGPDQGKFLELLVKIHKPKNILEVGSYYGYSSIWLARSLRGVQSTTSQSSHTNRHCEEGVNATNVAIQSSNDLDRDANARDDEQKLTCVEVSEKQCEILKEHFKLAKLEDFTEVIQGSGIEIMKHLIKEERQFDMIFIDADKANYPNYLDLSIDLLPKGGLLLVDNTLWNGKVADPSITDDKQTNSIRQFNDKLAASKHFDSLIITIQDGLAIGIRK